MLLTRVRKVASSSPGRSGGRIFFSRVNFVHWLLSIPFHPRVTAVGRKRPRSFYQKVQVAGYIWTRIHAPLAEQSRSRLTKLTRDSVGTFQGNGFTRSSSGNAQPQSSRLAEPLWTNPGLKSGIGVRELISTKKKKKKKEKEEEKTAQARNDSSKNKQVKKTLFQKRKSWWVVLWGTC